MKKMSKFEIRNITSEFRLNDDPDSRTITGLAIPVNSRSQKLYGLFYETIRSEAITEDFIQKQDIKFYMNHDASQGTFARCKYGTGSLRLYVTNRGLEFEFEAPKTVFGDMLLEGIRRGDYDSMSFAFRMPSDEQSEEWEEAENGDIYRYINKIEMIDEISALSCAPAYLDTDIDTKTKTSFERFMQRMKDKKEADKREQEEIDAQKEQELMTMYDDMLAELEKL